MDPSQSSAIRVLFQRLEYLLDRLDIGQQVLIERTDHIDARLERIELRARRLDEELREAETARRR